MGQFRRNALLYTSNRQIFLLLPTLSREHINGDGEDGCKRSSK